MKAIDLCEAMQEIRPEYIAAAHSDKKHLTGKWMARAAIAACLCLVISLVLPGPKPQAEAFPGVFTITALAASAEDEALPQPRTVLREGIAADLQYSWNPAMSCYPGLPLIFSTEVYPAAVFQVSVTAGRLLTINNSSRATNNGETATVPNGGKTYWSHVATEGQPKDAFAKVIVYEEGNIIGYLLIRIYPTGDSVFDNYRALLVESVSFPPINGKPQSVSEEDVLQAFDDLISKT